MCDILTLNANDITVACNAASSSVQAIMNCLYFIPDALWTLPQALLLLPDVAGPGRGAAFRLRLMSPVHKDPKCMLVCLQVIIRKDY